MSIRAHTVGAVAVTAAATALLALSFGVRAVLGMFVGPINTATGLGFAAVSMALAAANVVLLGALSTFLDVPQETWLEVIEARVPPRYVELNRQAFLQGRQLAAH